MEVSTAGYKIHIDTVASKLIIQGAVKDVKQIARRLSALYDSMFLECVSNATDTDESKRSCLLLYIDERFEWEVSCAK